MERPFFLIFVKYFYSLLTLLAFFSPVSYSIWLFLPAIILMWISYAFFKVGVYKGLKFNMPIRIQSSQNIFAFHDCYDSFYSTLY